MGAGLPFLPMGQSPGQSPGQPLWIFPWAADLAMVPAGAEDALAPVFSDLWTRLLQPPAVSARDTRAAKKGT